MINHEYMDLCNVCVIVNHGSGSKVIHIAKENGINGGTIMLGTGTFYNKIMDLFGLNDSRKEIVWMVCPTDVANKALAAFNEELKFEKRNHGIAYTMPIKMVVGIRNTVITNNNQEEDFVYQAIYTIVEKGNADDVIEAAALAGAKGGTVIEARGAGAHEVCKVFAIDIEPEKEIVLNLVPTEIVDNVVNAISTKMEVDKPGKGIIFVQPVSKTLGLHR